MDISVVICTYNRAENLRQTLEGFVAVSEAAPSPWELIVVDNNSNDETEGVCRGFAARLPLRYVKEPRPGKSCALNAGIEAAAGEIIALTDDDVDVEPGWLGALVRAAETYTAADFFGGKVISRWQGQPPRWFVENQDLLRSNPRVDLGDQPLTLRRGSEPVFVGANLAFRRRLFAGAARFREDLGPRGDGRQGGRVGPEEFEWEARLLEAGHEGVYVPEAVVHHRDPPWRMTESYVRHWYIQAGRSRVKEGKVPAGREWFGAPRYLWRELLTNAATYLRTRLIKPSRVWIPAQCRMWIAWGSIQECRASGVGVNARSNSLAVRIGSRWEWLDHRIGGMLLRISPQAFIQLRWPWPIKKPFERSSLVLCATGGGVGDELMCLPIFEEIKKRNPACRITFATRRPGFFKGHPAIDELTELRAGSQGIQLGYYYVIPPRRPLMTHMAECIGMIGHFEKINPPPLAPSKGIVAEMDGLTPPVIVVQPFSSGWTTNKNWPLELWRAAIQELVQEGTVVEVGTEPAFPPETFTKQFVSLAGRSSLHDLAYIISRANLFIGPSSSGMHLANAYQVPSVIIFGGYESPAGYQYPLTTALYTPVECAPCWRQSCPYELKCLRAINSERVVNEARKALKARESRELAHRNCNSSP